MVKLPSLNFELEIIDRFLNSENKLSWFIQPIILLKIKGEING